MVFPPLAMGEGENMKIGEVQQRAATGLRVFDGKEKFPSSNSFQTLLALGIWLGAIHFDAVLVLFSLLFLPLSKSLLLVPSPPLSEDKEKITFFFWGLSFLKRC